MKAYGVTQRDWMYEAYDFRQKPVPVSPSDRVADRTRKKSARQRAKRVMEEVLCDASDTGTPTDCD